MKQVQSNLNLNKQLKAALELDERSIKVYLALMELGEANVQSIAESAKSERTGTYDVLERLESKKLVLKKSQGKRLTFIANSPNILRDNLSNRLSQIETVLPELTTLYERRIVKPIFEFKIGLAAIQSELMELFEGNVSTINLFLGQPNLINILDKEFWEYFHLVRINNRIKLKVLTFNADEKIIKGYVETRRLLNNINLPISKLIAGDNIFYFFLQNPETPYLMSITSSYFALNEQLVFDLLWKSGKRIRN